MEGGFEGSISRVRENLEKLRGINEPAAVPNRHLRTHPALQLSMKPRGQVARCERAYDELKLPVPCVHTLN